MLYKPVNYAELFLSFTVLSLDNHISSLLSFQHEPVFGKGSDPGRSTLSRYKIKETHSCPSDSSKEWSIKRRISLFWANRVFNERATLPSLMYTVKEAPNRGGSTGQGSYSSVQPGQIYGMGGSLPVGAYRLSPGRGGGAGDGASDPPPDSTRMALLSNSLPLTALDNLFIWLKFLGWQPVGNQSATKWLSLCGLR